MNTNKPWWEITCFLPGYGHFPYIVMRVAYAIYMQIPIHFIKEGEEGDVRIQPGTHVYGFTEAFLALSKPEQIKIAHDALLVQTKNIIEKLEKHGHPIESWRICLVEGPNMAYYFEDDEIKFNSLIPSGGTLITQGNKILAMNRAHYLD